MALYHLKNKDGLIGPVGPEVVRDLIDAGVLQQDAGVSRDGSTFRKLSEFPEFQASLPQPQGSTTPTYSGDLSRVSFLKLFMRLYLSEATGRLLLRRDTLFKEIYLQSGKPVAVTSNLADERLGAFMVAHKVLTPGQLWTAVRDMSVNGYALLDTLVRLGFLGPAEAYSELQTQQTARLADAVSWTSGRYAFYAGETFSGNAVDIQLNPPHVILNAVRSLDHFTLEQRLAGHNDHVVLRRNHPVFGRWIFDFNAHELHLMQLIDNTKTLRELRVGLAMRREISALAILPLLADLEAVRFVASPQG